ncbi:MAG TPA: energy-coupled thiamine transporter ThiT [Bacilli bacterium]|nr:energy-coupled thiamine transporter ThiT [Bacilli bacterium]
MEQKWYRLSIYDITEIAILVAFAVILDLPGLKIKLSAGPGSISLTMVPLILLALRFNMFKSFIGIGIVYGLITNIIDGYGFITFPLDYLLGYGSLALISLFRPEKHAQLTLKRILLISLGVFLGGAFRILFSTISGVLLYSYTFIASFLYNLPLIGISLAASFLLVIITYPLMHKHLQNI